MYKSFSISLIPVVFLIGCAGQVTTPSSPQKTVAQEETSTKPEVVIEPAAEQKATPLEPEVLYRLMAAEVAGQRGQFDVATQNYLQAALLSRDPAVVERAARIAVYARDDVSALTAAKLWVELKPDNLQAHTVIATVQIKQAQYEAALVTLDKLLTLSEQQGEQGYHFIFTLLGRQKDKQAALALMEKLMQRRGASPEALLAFGRLGLLVNELEKASQATEMLLEQRPLWLEAQQLWVNLLLRKGQDEEAMVYLESTLEEQPENSSLRLYYARKLVDERRFPEAHEQFRLLLEQDDHNHDARYALGLLALEMKRLREASEHFERLYQDGQRHNESAYYLGQVAERQKKNTTAIRWYAQVRKGDHYLDAQIRIAVVTARQGDIKSARDRLHNIDTNTASVELRLYLVEGDILREAHQYQEAFDLYSEALAGMPDNSQLLYARALTAEKIDQLEVTLQDLQAIVEREPDNAQALNALGYTLADRTNRYDEALKYIMAAYKMHPDDAAIIDSMGWVHYRMGDYETALKYLRKAFAMLKDPEIGAHLGEVLWVSGEHQEARAVWDEALQAKPEHKILLDVIKRFTE